jgi:hypothetical protein
MKHLKPLISLFLAALCLVSFAACRPVDPGFGNTVAYANWSDDPSIADGALNRAVLTGEGGHLPIFKLDTLADLNSFKAKYGGVLTMDRGWNDVDSFDEAIKQAQWNQASFFAKNTLFVVYVPTNSGSYRFGVQDISLFDGAMCVYVTQLNHPGNVTDDMSGWFILIEVADAELRDCSSFDAVLVDGK